MIDDGLIIMAVGMLVVFAFLAIMVVMMRYMSGLILKFFPEPVESASAPRISGENDVEVAVAIAAAYTRN